MEGGGAIESSAPSFFTDTIYQILDNALDWGISEADFWDMTLAELARLFKSKQRMQKQKAQEQAYFDYTLADLIGRSVARMYSKTNEYPEIQEIYPALFEEEKQKKQDELSVIRFKQFADAYNRKFEKGGSK